jgi:DNA-binding MarR family transcriptional regulator
MTPNRSVDARRTAERGVLDAIRRITRALRVSAMATQSSVGISAAQLYVLRTLAERESASITDLAALTMTDRSSVAAVVERLVDQGLAHRSPSPDDRRRARVEITETGARLAGQAAPPPTDLLVGGLHSMSDAQVAELNRALSGFVAALGLDKTPAEMLFEESGSGRRRAGQEGSD